MDPVFRFFYESRRSTSPKAVSRQRDRMPFDETVKKQEEEEEEEEENGGERGGRSVIVLLRVTVPPTEGAIPDHLWSQGRSDHLPLPLFRLLRSSVPLGCETICGQNF